IGRRLFFNDRTARGARDPGHCVGAVHDVDDHYRYLAHALPERVLGSCRRERRPIQAAARLSAYRKLRRQGHLVPRLRRRRFNNAFGLELGLMDFGRFDRAGGETKAYGLDIPLILGFPIGANSSVFLKAGVHYSKTEVSAATPASIQTGTESGWGPRAGVGATFGLTPQWAVRADWDRYRVEFPGTKDDIDTLTVGAQYTFR